MICNILANQHSCYCNLLQDTNGAAVKMAYLGLHDIGSVIGYHDHNGNAMTAISEWDVDRLVLNIHAIYRLFCRINRMININSINLCWMFRSWDKDVLLTRS